VSTRVLSIALCPELVALVAGSADSPPDGTGRASSPGSRAVRVLPVLRLRTRPGQVRVLHANMLLELLEGVVRSLGKRVQPVVHMSLWYVAIGHQGGRGNGVVWRETV
jgi:hypothetical protein